MADLEAIFQDISYMLALNQNSLRERISKRVQLPDLFCHQLILEKLKQEDENFNIVESTLSDKMGFELFYQFVTSHSKELANIIKLYFRVKAYLTETFDFIKEKSFKLILENLNSIFPDENIIKSFEVSTFENGDFSEITKFMKLKKNDIIEKSRHLLQQLLNFEKDLVSKNLLSPKRTSFNFQKLRKSLSPKPSSNTKTSSKSKSIQNLTSNDLNQSSEKINLISASNVSVMNALSVHNENENLNVDTSKSVSRLVSVSESESNMNLEAVLSALNASIMSDVIVPLHNKFLESKNYYRYVQWKGYFFYKKMTLDDFNMHRIIGRGGFGEVYGCHKMDSGKLFAIKLQDKRRLKSKKCIKSALLERKLLGKMNFPFIVNICYCLQTNSKLIMVLDLMDGGDLSYHISEKKKLTEDELKFIASEILLGIEYLHSKSILYRDLKPANVLLDKLGHVKLSDFGLAIMYNEELPPRSCVGTYGYMAPEVIDRKPYGFGSDWFSFGCLLYKCITGTSPFRNKKDNNKECERRTLYSEPSYEYEMSPDLKELIIALFVKNPSNRLGNCSQGYKDVKKSKYFSNVDWFQVYFKMIPPPFKPPQNEINAHDVYQIGNFSNSNYNKVKIDEKDQKHFDKCEYVNVPLWQDEMMEYIFDKCNNTFLESKNKNYDNFHKYLQGIKDNPPILYGFVYKLGGSVFSIYRKCFIQLYETRITIGYTCNSVKTVITFDEIEELEDGPMRGINIKIQTKFEKSFIFKLKHKFEHEIWLSKLKKFMNSNIMAACTNIKSSNSEMLSTENVKSVPNLTITNEIK